MRGLPSCERFSSLKRFALKADVKKGLFLPRSAQICRAGGSGIALSCGLPSPLLRPPLLPNDDYFSTASRLAAGSSRQVQLLWYDRHSNLALQSWLPWLNLMGQRGKKEKDGERRGRMSTSPWVSAARDANVQKTTRQPPRGFRTEGGTRPPPNLFPSSSWFDCKAQSQLCRRSLPTCACPRGAAQAESRLPAAVLPVFSGSHRQRSVCHGV